MGRSVFFSRPSCPVLAAKLASNGVVRLSVLLSVLPTVSTLY